MKRLPSRPNLDHLRRQAKEVLHEMRRDRPAPDAVHLAAAQHAIAGEYGFRSWRALKARVERILEIERHVRRFEKVHARDVPAIRPLVSVSLVAEGALGHPSPLVRRLCVQLLDHVVDERGIPTLVRALDDPVPRVRRHALHALTCDRCKPHVLHADVVTPVLERVRRDPNEKVRFYAVAALQPRLGEPRVCATLARVATEDAGATVREAAARLLEGGRPNLWSRGRHTASP